MRAVRPILITLAVLIVLFVVVDRVAVWFAESEAADQLRQARQTDGKPSVSIGGFPFLTQLLGGELDDVHASAKGIQAEGDDGTSVRVTKLNMDLKNVKFSDGFSSATAGSASGNVLISYEDLSDAAPNGVKISYGGESAKAGVSEVKAAVAVPLVGEQSVVSEVRLEDGDTVTVRAKSIPGSEISGVEEKVRQYTDFSKQITGLPAGIRLTSLKAGPEGVTIQVSGSQVSLDN